VPFGDPAEVSEASNQPAGACRSRVDPALVEPTKSLMRRQAVAVECPIAALPKDEERLKIGSSLRKTAVVRYRALLRCRPDFEPLLGA
jgi:hypothetical protein